MQNDSIKNVIAYWCKLHEETVESKYLISYGKDQKIIKDIISVYGMEKTVQLIAGFFESAGSDPFIQETGVTVGIFKTQIPKLLLKIQKTKHKEETGKL